MKNGKGVGRRERGAAPGGNSFWEGEESNVAPRQGGGTGRREVLDLHVPNNVQRGGEMKKPPIFVKESPEKKENLYILRSRKFLF